MANQGHAFRSLEPGVNDRPNVLATKRRGEPTRHEPVYDPHALEMASSCHGLKKCTVKRQRALELCKIHEVRLAQKLRLLSAGVLGVDGVHSIHVFHDREGRCPQAAAQPSKPQPAQTVPQPGSMEWFKAQEEKG